MYKIRNVDGDIVEATIPNKLVTIINEAIIKLDSEDGYSTTTSFVNPNLKSVHFAILKDGKEKYSVNIEDNNG